MTLFEKIIAGEIPSYRIYEDENVYAFLDIQPNTKGHTLVIPKKPYENLLEIPEELFQPLLRAAQKIAARMKSELGAEGFNLRMNNGAVAGQEIFHAHLHLIPRYAGETEDPIHTHIEMSPEEFEEVREKLEIIE